ncbi:hypothetical protein ABZX65_26480 [Streptomyces sp. NPDC003300]|uniref:hypothetical protein n=1 Tax=unclassified Streptomyces TaxID=2593676 RepID=UPI0033ACB59C
MTTDHAGTAADSPDTATRAYTRAQSTVALLRDELAVIGLTPDEVRMVLPQTDIEGRGYVRLGTVSVESADLLLAALSGPPTPAGPAS